MAELHHEIRPASSRDAPAITAVIQAVYDEYGFILDVPNDMPDLLDMDAHYDQASGGFFVCVVDNNVVGTIGVQLDGQPTAEVFRLYVHFQYRGLGLGHRLLERAVTWARQRQAARVTLWSDVRFDHAHKLYTRYGFVRGLQRQLTDANYSLEYQFSLPLKQGVNAMSQGSVVSIHIAPEAKASPVAVSEVRAVPGKGLEGDRYFYEIGTFSDQPGPSREVTLIEIEAVEALARDYETAINPADSRRNIITRAVALNHLVGKEFCVGEVRLRGIRLCEPCAHLASLTVRQVMTGLVHRGGLRAQILTDGIIRVGDAVQALESE